MNSDWTPNQPNLIGFVMIDQNGVEVAGLGNTFSLSLSKNDSAVFTPSAGTKAESGNGWYTYLATVGEANTPGIVKVRVTAPGCVQQNLEYVVQSRTAGAVSFTYHLTQAPEGTGVPIAGALVVVTSDIGGASPIASGETNASGDVVFYLVPGTYYLWRSKAGWNFANPDTEVIP